MPNFEFRPRLIPGIAVVLGLALFVHLGQWQAGKAERRQAEIREHTERAQHAVYRLGAQQVEAETLRGMPVTVRGHFEPDHRFFVDNRLQDGKPGLHLVMPLRIEGSETRVLVNRGWIAWPDRSSDLPSVLTPTGEIEINGVADVPSGKKFFLMPEHEDANPALWTRLDPERFEKAYTGVLQPVVVLQSDVGATDTLVRKWPPPEDRVAMHQSYSMQWFGMAAALLIFYGVASLRKKESA